MAVKIITDSTATLTEEQIKRYDIRRVTLFIVDAIAAAAAGGDDSSGGSVNDGGGETPIALAEPEISMDFHEFYGRLKNMDALPKTAQPAPGDFHKTYTDILEAGDDALMITMSGGLSGTCEGAQMMAEQVMRERPEYAGRIAVVNSCSTGMGLSYPVLEAARFAEEGADLATCKDAAVYTASCTRFLFVPHSLEYLRRGGRLGTASALLGSALKLVPILGPDKMTGAVHTYAKVRTFPRALMTLKDKMLEDIERSGGLKELWVQYIAERAEADTFREKVIEPLFGAAMSVPPSSAISPAVGAHIGPAVGVAYLTNAPVLPENIAGGLGVLSSAKAGVSERLQAIRESERFQAIKQKVEGK